LEDNKVRSVDIYKPGTDVIEETYLTVSKDDDRESLEAKLPNHNFRYKSIITERKPTIDIPSHKSIKADENSGVENNNDLYEVKVRDYTPDKTKSGTSSPWVVYDALEAR